MVNAIGIALLLLTTLANVRRTNQQVNPGGSSAGPGSTGGSSSTGSSSTGPGSSTGGSSSTGSSSTGPGSSTGGSSSTGSSSTGPGSSTGGSSSTGSSSTGPGGSSSGPGGAIGQSDNGALSNPEVSLVNSVLDSYPAQALSRPASPSDVINATIQIMINNFNGVDDIEQLMSFSGIIVVKWNDSYINWEPSENANIDTIILRRKDIWLPLIIQSSDPKSMKPILDAYANANSERLWVKYNGTVTAATANNFETQCNLDLSTFPFDSQSCSFTFQGWNYPSDLLAILPASPSYSAQQSALYSPEWIITNISASDQLAYFNSLYFSCVTFTITATRRPDFYILNVLLPCALMAVLALGTFLFPMDVSRAGFAITVVLAFAIFQTLVVSTLPKTSENIPLIMYIVCQMFVGGIITFYSIWISWLNNKYSSGDTPLPPILGALTCRRASRPRRGRTNLQIAEIARTTAAPEISHAALMVMNELDKEESAARCRNDWNNFFNTLDILVMLACIILSIALPILVFCTSLFQSFSTSSIESTVQLSSVPKYVDVTRPTPGTFATGGFGDLGGAEGGFTLPSGGMGGSVGPGGGNGPGGGGPSVGG